MSSQTNFDQIFSPEVLQKLFPPTISNDFFEALFGDANEGAFDISLSFRGATNSKLLFELQLHERVGHCLACNLTQGLPQVFSRHPIININGVVQEIDNLLGEKCSCKEWSLGHTEQQSNSLHVVPLSISID